MVSESKILGKPSVVLISIGSTKFPFLRVKSSIKKLDKNKYKIFDKFTSPAQFINIIKKSNKIIVHGGIATVFLVVKYAKHMPLIIPRLAKYKEHVDNHQLCFVKYLKNKVPNNLKNYFVVEENIDKIITNYLQEKNKINNLRKYLFLDRNKDKLINNLEEYIDRL